MHKEPRFYAKKYLNDVVELASDLIKIKSISGQEKEIGAFVANKMERMEFDEVSIDKAGNVIGIIKGTGEGKSLMLNSHMDTVSEGVADLWQYPPFSGEIADGAIWGRGASDTKGAFAAQICAAHIMKKEGILPKGDIYVIGVVHEEDSGLGSIIITQNLGIDYGIMGEATENDISIFNRGRIRFDVIIQGKSCHASVPENGVNPHFFLAEFVRRLKDLDLEEDNIFGKSSIAPTLIKSSETNTNVIPGKLTLSLDYRNIPGDSPEQVQDKLIKLANECLLPGVKVWVERVKNPIECYTGFRENVYEGAPAFTINQDHLLVTQAKEALEYAFGHKVKVKGWTFSTDSGYFMNAKIPVIGFSPAEIRLCHTTEDRIDIDMLEKGLAGNIALINRLCNLRKNK